MKFFIADAFTMEKYRGNTAGIVLVEGEFPAEGEMTRIAAELRYSETVFVKREGAARFHCRYFTPVGEVDLCGHATVAAFATLLSRRLLEPGVYQNRTLAGNLRIEASPERVFMEMAAPEHRMTIDGPKELHRLYGIMGADTPQIGGLFPEIISTGLPDILLPVADERALADLSPDFAALRDLSGEYGVVGVHAFCCGCADGLVHCRNFAPLYDIDEEAATGTSTGALTYYLYRHGLLKEGSLHQFIQGEAMGRRSEIFSRLTVLDDAVSIQVGGAAAVLVEGILL